MGFLDLIKRRPTKSRHSSAKQTPRRVRGSYDAAKTTDDNRRHWLNADHLSALAATRADVRQIIRARARYEVANNSYARGIVRTVADYVVGSGPRLQCQSGDPEIDRRIEREFAEWASAQDLAAKLHTMRIGQAQSGESFARFATDDDLPTPVKLDVRLIESDQVASPYPAIEPDLIDGVRINRAGRPVSYHVLHRHPGDTHDFAGLSFDGIEIPARFIVHLFRADRPGQLRGIPEITPALPLFAQLRRYTLATLSAAETAANFAGVLKTMAPDNADDSEYASPMDLIEVERNALLALPYGSELSQLKPEQPATNYPDFKRELIAEAARPFAMPYAIAAGDASDHNYASVRTDYQAFFRWVGIEQVALNRQINDRIFAAWMREAVLIENYLPQSLRMRNSVLPHGWIYDGNPHVDPLKEANAQAVRLANHTTTLATEFARDGRDWETELEQRAREFKRLEELGLSLDLTAYESPENNDDE